MDTSPSLTVKQFFNDFPVVRLSKGEVLLRPDDELTHVFYLLKGTVVQYDISSGGNEVIVNTFKPGAFFPMSTAINRSRNSYFFESSTTIEIRKAPAEAVVAFVRSHPDICFDLLRRVYIGTDGLLRRMAHLMGGNARSRLVFELLNACARFGSPGPDGSVGIPLTEKDIAKRSGLSRETISRTMRVLKDAGLVTVQPGGMTVTNIAELEAVIGSEL